MAKLNFLGTVYLYHDLVSQRKLFSLLCNSQFTKRSQTYYLQKKAHHHVTELLCLFTPRPESLQPEYKQTLGNTSAWNCMQSSKLQRFP